MKKIANYNISLKVFLQNEKWETLILKTPDSSSYEWNYDLPGGRIDEDEFYVDLLDILDREIKEEVWDIKYKINNKPYDGCYGSHHIGYGQIKTHNPGIYRQTNGKNNGTSYNGSKQTFNQSHFLYLSFHSIVQCQANVGIFYTVPSL